MEWNLPRSACKLHPSLVRPAGWNLGNSHLFSRLSLLLYEMGILSTFRAAVRITQRVLWQWAPIMLHAQQIFSSPLSVFPSVPVKNRICCFMRAIVCLLGGFYSLFWRYTRLETNLQMNVMCCCYSWCGNVNDQELVNLITHYGKIKSDTHAQTLQLTEIPWHLRTEDIHHSLLPSFLPQSSFPLLYLKLHGEDTNKTESILSGQLSPCTTTTEPALQGLWLTITGPTCFSDWQVHVPQSPCTAREASAARSPWTTTRESSCSKEDPVTAKNKQYNKNFKSKEDTVLPKKKKRKKALLLSFQE